MRKRESLVAGPQRMLQDSNGEMAVPSVTIAIIHVTVDFAWNDGTLHPSAKFNATLTGWIGVRLIQLKMEERYESNGRTFDVRHSAAALLLPFVHLADVRSCSRAMQRIY